MPKVAYHTHVQVLLLYNIVM